MTSLTEIYTNQKDLNDLCQDRLLQTNEIFPGNAYYGNDLILKTYAGLPHSYPLKVVIPHGIYLDPNFIWIAEQKSPLPAILNYSDFRKNVVSRKTSKFVISSASPFLYLTKLLEGKQNSSREGTIFFPAHSTHHVTVSMNYKTLADELEQLDDEYKPITVCMYWRDVNLGYHLPFLEKGFPVVSAGHIYDPSFLFRFYDLCSGHKYAAGNSISSHVFYSIKSGCSYFHLDSIKFNVHTESDTYKNDISPRPILLQKYFKSLFSEPQKVPTTEQLDFVDYFLGTKYLKRPHELRKQLLYAELLDKIGIIVWNKGYPKKMVFPPFLKRCEVSFMGTSKRTFSKFKKLF